MRRNERRCEMCEIEEWVSVQIDEDEEEIELVPSTSWRCLPRAREPRQPQQAKVDEGLPSIPHRTCKGRAVICLAAHLFSTQQQARSRGCSTFRACGTHSLLVVDSQRINGTERLPPGGIFITAGTACATRSGITWADGLAFIRSSGSFAAVLHWFVFVHGSL